MHHETLTANPATTRRGGEDIDLGLIGQALKRRSPFIFGVTLLVFIASFLVVNLITPRYTGEANLLLESRDSFYTRLGANERDAATMFDAEAVQSQVQVIKSRDLAREAVKQLGLVGNPEFDPVVAGMGPVRRLLVLTGLARNPAERAPDDRVIDAYYDHLLVYPIGRSRVVAIEFTSRDPELAARMANTVATLYLDTLQAAKKDTARFASTWLAGTIEPLRKRVAEAEAKVEEFRATTGLLVGANNITITQQQLADLSTQLSAARSTQADAQAKAQLIRELIKADRILEIPDVANNDLIRRVAEQRITLRGQLALESRTLLSAHPRIKELNAQLADLDQQIRTAAERTARTLENEARMAGSRLESLQGALGDQKTVAVSANENEIQLRALERDARTQREQLEAYLVKYREAVARDSENAMPADARIVSRAFAPTTPSFPKKLPIVILATLAAFVLSCGLIVTRELLTGRAMGVGVAHAAAPAREPAAGQQTVAKEMSAEPIASASAPVSTSSPGGSSPPDAVAADAAQTSPVAAPLLAHALVERARRKRLGEKVGPEANPADEAPPSPYVELAEQLPPARADGRGRRVLATEAADGHGAMTAARALARHLARNQRVILVSVADDAISQERLGLSDLVAAKASFAEIIERETGSRLHLMAPGAGDPALLARTPEMVDLALSALDQTYDWVFLIVPGAHRTALGDFFAARTDGIVIAANEADMGSGAASELHEAFQAAGAKHIVIAVSAEAKAAVAAA